MSITFTLRPGDHTVMVNGADAWVRERHVVRCHGGVTVLYTALSYLSDGSPVTHIFTPDELAPGTRSDEVDPDWSEFEFPLGHCIGGMAPLAVVGQHVVEQQGIIQRHYALRSASSGSVRIVNCLVLEGEDASNT